MPPTDEPAVFATSLRQLLERVADETAQIPEGRLDDRVLSSGNTPVVLVSHVVGAARGWALGVGCGLDVHRDLVAEFETRGATVEELRTSLLTLASEVDTALAAINPTILGEVVVPQQSLMGVPPPEAVSRRGAIVRATSHASTHLGELMMIKDLMVERRA